MKIAITLDDAQFRHYFAELAQRLGNLQPVHDRIGATLESRVQQRFSLKVGSPAHAGIALAAAPGRCPKTGLPRTRGDRPAP